MPRFLAAGCIFRKIDNFLNMDRIVCDMGLRTVVMRNESMEGPVAGFLLVDKKWGNA